MATARIRNAAAALALAGVVVMGGCTSTFTARPYTPGIGTNVDAGPVKVRALVLVADGDTARLTGSIVTHQADTLVSISGHAQDAGFKPLSALSFPDTRIALGTQKLVTLTDKNLTVSSPDLEPGLTATLTLNFEKAGAATVVVPVVSSEHDDYSALTTSAPSTQS